jgi:hypothetical protein
MDKKRLAIIQERLSNDIHRGRDKRDFSPFDIYQFVDGDKKEAFLEEENEESNATSQDVIGLLLSAKKSIMIFAGNFSWAVMTQGGMMLLDTLEEAANKGVKIQVVCGIHLPAIDNVERVIELNKKLKNKIEIRHAFQPLRAVIVDDKVMRLKEIKNPLRENPRYKKTFIFYSIYDPIWVRWMQKVFRGYFDSGDYAEARIRELKKIQKVK